MRRTMLNSLYFDEGLDKEQQIDLLNNMLDEGNQWLFNQYYIGIDNGVDDDGWINLEEVDLDYIVDFYLDKYENLTKDELVNLVWELAFNSKQYSELVDEGFEDWLDRLAGE